MKSLFIFLFVFYICIYTVESKLHGRNIFRRNKRNRRRRQISHKQTSQKIEKELNISSDPVLKNEVKLNTLYNNSTKLQTSGEMLKVEESYAGNVDKSVNTQEYKKISYDKNKHDNNNYQNVVTEYKRQNTNLCYEIITSDDPYSNKYDLSFYDISSTGTQITNFTSSDDGYVELLVETSFVFFDLYSPSTLSVSTNGIVVFDLISDGVTDATSNIGNRLVGPYAVIAGLWGDYSIGTSTEVFYETTSEYTIIQWNSLEAFGSTATVTMQIRIYESLIVTSYLDVNCDKSTNVDTLPQFGVKPSQGGFSIGYKSSLRIASCINGQFNFPRSGSGVAFKPCLCDSLIGQTGINKNYNKNILVGEPEYMVDHYIIY